MLLHQIEMDELATEEHLKVNLQEHLREHYEWLRRAQAIVEGEMKELEQALATCVENQER
jgi:hypothetical protein